MNLKDETDGFASWAAMRHAGTLPESEFVHGAGEWECDYPFWSEWYAAVESLLSSGAAPSIEDVERVLFALARDNEDETILGMLELYPATVLPWTERAVTHPDFEVRWQFAVLLGRLGERELLEFFLKDREEYVRRRATHALQAIGKP
ncbi:hypothetical protein ASA1KI_03520 [Opitutales bacterium ASA1]|uniref:HEAT repeat domain-containing protein n=1 Tax=Congregicoccus parvus TaxID=3081749 RepID=UPI002B312525|nr:hypothetical protein ASA1KI_03520 [Opitutales bacterium ASA1]